MRTLMSATIAVALLLPSRNVCLAQEAGSEASPAMKPIVAVALSGYNDVLDSLRLISPQLAMMLEGAVDNLTEGQGLDGLDKSRPWGLLVRTDGQEFPTQAFIPVTKLEKLFESLEPAIGKPEEVGDGVYEFETETRVLYLKQVGDWAFVSITPDALENVPKNPVEDLGDLPDQYDIGVRVTIKNIPPLFRQMALGAIQMASQQALRQQPAADEEEQLRQQAVEQRLKQLSTVLDEVDSFVLGMRVDEEARLGVLEYALTAVEGTDLAKQMAQPEEVKTDFAGFLLPDIPVTFNAASRLAESDVEMMKTTLEAYRAKVIEELEAQDLSDEELQQAKELVETLMDARKKTLDSGKMDIGAAAAVGPETLRVAAGAHVVDPGNIEEFLKTMAKQLAEEEPEYAGAIKLDVEEFEGVRFHRVDVPLRELEESEDLRSLVGEILDIAVVMVFGAGDESLSAAGGLGTAELLKQVVEQEELIGDTLKVVIGVGEESLYVAAGRDPADLLKQAIEKSKAQADKSVPPMQLTVALTPVVKAIGSVVEDPQVASMAEVIAQILEGADNKDHLTVTATAIPNGMKARLELEEGGLKVLGSLPMFLAGLGPQF